MDTLNKADPRLQALLLLHYASYPQRYAEAVDVLGPPPAGDVGNFDVLIGVADREQKGIHRPSYRGTVLHGLRLGGPSAEDAKRVGHLVAEVIVMSTARGDGELWQSLADNKHGFFTGSVALEMIPELLAENCVKRVDLCHPARPLAHGDCGAHYSAKSANDGAAYVGAKDYRDATGVTGRGTVVAVVDTTIDVHNPVFRRGDSSQITHLWDQRARDKSGKAPVPWAKGREYDHGDLTAELRAKQPYVCVPHGHDQLTQVTTRRDHHGTRVASLAAGQGNPKRGWPAGVAPGADLIFVATSDSGGQPIGGSCDVVEAIAYAFDRANGRPCVVCLSLGDNLGAHDGTTLLEEFIEASSSVDGRVVVVSAGNSLDQGNRHHRRVNVTSAGEAKLQVGTHGVQADRLQIWYDGDEPLDVVLSVANSSDTVHLPAKTHVSFATHRLGDEAWVIARHTLGWGRFGRNVIDITLAARYYALSVSVNITLSTGSSRAVEGHAWIDGGGGRVLEQPPPER